LRVSEFSYFSRGLQRATVCRAVEDFKVALWAMRVYKAAFAVADIPIKERERFLGDVVIVTMAGTARPLTGA
jgi:hypothetical protein